MYIGITERGDAGIDFSWERQITERKVDGAVLITKKISDKFINSVYSLHYAGFKIIVHCTVTGWGGTRLEPNVPKYKEQLNMLKKLISTGFPAENCIIRIDPIFPTDAGLKWICEVAEYAYQSELLPIRVRVSILDEYKHVKDRFRRCGFEPVYGETCFQAGNEQICNTADMLAKITREYGITHECCAEPILVEKADGKRREYNLSVPVCIETGCISKHDLDIMGLNYDLQAENNQKRSGCHCLSCKKEMLNARKQCLNGCLYCYWKN